MSAVILTLISLKKEKERRKKFAKWWLCIWIKPSSSSSCTNCVNSLVGRIILAQSCSYNSLFFVCFTWRQVVKVLNAYVNITLSITGVAFFCLFLCHSCQLEAGDIMNWVCLAYCATAAVAQLKLPLYECNGALWHRHWHLLLLFSFCENSFLSFDCLSPSLPLVIGYIQLSVLIGAAGGFSSKKAKSHLRVQVIRLPAAKTLNPH